MFLFPLLSACTAPVPLVEAPRCPAESPTEGEVRVFAEGFSVDHVSGTEGLVFSPDGRLFVGGSGVAGGGFVAEVFSDGSHAILTDLPGSVGLSWWGDRIVVAVSGGGLAGEEGGLVLVDPDTGETEVLATGIPAANFVIPTPWGALLVSNPGGDTLWEVTADGSVSAWLEGIPSPNGMVFSVNGRTLFVAQTYGSPNTFHAVAIQDDHSAGAIADLATFADGSTQDGVEIDLGGAVYVVLNLPGEVVRISPDGRAEVIGEGVDFGASLRFGRGAFDPCSLYVTSLFTDKIYQLGVGFMGEMSVQ